MKMLSTQFELPVDELAAFCRRWGVARLEVFGSVLREDFGPESDLDFLYTPGPGFRRDRVYGPWGQNHMAEDLGRLLGRKVDLLERARVEQMENWIKRQNILSTATPVYEHR
jgi:predicted nucleotidyltransferase